MEDRRREEEGGKKKKKGGRERNRTCVCVCVCGTKGFWEELWQIVRKGAYAILARLYVPVDTLALPVVYA